jgi:hypothetical protein
MRNGNVEKGLDVEIRLMSGEGLLTTGINSVSFSLKYDRDMTGLLQNSCLSVHLARGFDSCHLSAFLSKTPCEDIQLARFRAVSALTLTKVTSAFFMYDMDCLASSGTGLPANE